MARWLALVPAPIVLALAGAASAQLSGTESAQPPLRASAAPYLPAQDPRVPHPIFGAITVGGELGASYATDAKLAVLANPFSS